jgi:hypothetical protein
MSEKFQRRKEDFTCQNCGQLVIGDGYTNHCPTCLWSKHVDIYPGDRDESCGGMMQPISVEVRGDKYIIQHRCTQCGTIRRNSASEQDDFERILEIASQNSLSSS